MGFVEDDHAVEIAAQPVDDLLHARGLRLARLRPQRGVGGEEDALGEPDRRALLEAGERRDEKPFLAERRPVALRVLDQLVGLRDPDRAAAALEPIVEDDAGDLAALAGAGAVAEKPAAAEADGVLGVVGRGRDDIEGLVHRPGAGEMARMRLAGIDDALELRVAEQAVADDGGRQMRTVARLRRRHRRHRRRLNQSRRMRLRAGDADRLEGIPLIERVGDVAVFGLRPIARLVGKLDGFDRNRSGDRPRALNRGSRRKCAQGCTRRAHAGSSSRRSRAAARAARSSRAGRRDRWRSPARTGRWWDRRQAHDR